MPELEPVVVAVADDDETVTVDVPAWSAASGSLRVAAGDAVRAGEDDVVTNADEVSVAVADADPVADGVAVLV